LHQEGNDFFAHECLQYIGQWRMGPRLSHSWQKEGLP
jgi:hypothetical protein